MRQQDGKVVVSGCANLVVNILLEAGYDLIKGKQLGSGGLLF
jgi:hypothetical protein